MDSKDDIIKLILNHSKSFRTYSLLENELDNYILKDDFFSVEKVAQVDIIPPVEKVEMEVDIYLQ